ncbi:MAG: hypothetical protein QHJ81_03015 [Anaerolineae bacterium]|nr:hypothetical protein [Anaerolineae bacterium]
MSSHEKSEKQEEKEEKGGQSMEEKWVRDPVGTAMGALILIWLGVTMFLANLPAAGVEWSNQWAWFLLGLGAILILEAVVRLAVPEYRRPVGGKIIGGIVLLIIGASGSFLPLDLAKWWPLIPIGIGVAILLGGFFRRRGT